MIPMTVVIKGKNCLHPNLKIDINNFGLANLYPTINRIAARTESGIIFNNPGIVITEINKKTPWRMADILVFPPD